MNLQLAYRYILSLSTNENMLKKETKQNKMTKKKTFIFGELKDILDEN